MLYKDLISTYGSSLAAKSGPRDDPVWHMGWSEELQLFREYAVGALQQAKVYWTTLVGRRVIVPNKLNM